MTDFDHILELEREHMERLADIDRWELRMKAALLLAVFAPLLVSLFLASPVMKSWHSRYQSVTSGARR